MYYCIFDHDPAKPCNSSKYTFLGLYTTLQYQSKQMAFPKELLVVQYDAAALTFVRSFFHIFDGRGPVERNHDVFVRVLYPSCSCDDEVNCEFYHDEFHRPFNNEMEYALVKSFGKRDDMVRIDNQFVYIEVHPEPRYVRLKNFIKIDLNLLLL